MSKEVRLLKAELALAEDKANHWTQLLLYTLHAIGGTVTIKRLTEPPENGKLNVEMLDPETIRLTLVKE